MHPKAVSPVTKKTRHPSAGFKRHAMPSGKKRKSRRARSWKIVTWRGSSPRPRSG